MGKKKNKDGLGKTLINNFNKKKTEKWKGKEVIFIQ